MGLDPTAANCAALSGDTFTERGGKWILGNYGNTLYDHYYAPNADAWDCMNVQQQKAVFSARSSHLCGVNLEYCDGSTRFVSNDVDVDVWRAAATRCGGETVSVAP